jgi:hypothetical protein
MRLTEAQSRELLAKHGVYVTEACEKCGKLLCHVRFTRYGELGEWCSQLCRDGDAIPESCHDTRKGGRPPKYRTDRERRVVERRQNAIRQQAFRQRLNVTENPPVNDSFHASSKAQNRLLAIPIAERRV